MSAAKNVRRVSTFCYNCVSGPDFMKVKVENGVATEIEPNFDHALFEMLRTHANVEPEWFEPEPAPAWRDANAVPPGIAHQAALASLSAPDVAAWARLAPFQRYVLAKLARKPESNHDFAPAMREFGLAAPL